MKLEVNCWNDVSIKVRGISHWRRQDGYEVKYYYQQASHECHSKDIYCKFLTADVSGIWQVLKQIPSSVIISTTHIHVGLFLPKQWRDDSIHGSRAGDHLVRHKTVWITNPLPQHHLPNRITQHNKVHKIIKLITTPNPCLIHSAQLTWAGIHC